MSRHEVPEWFRWRANTLHPILRDWAIRICELSGVTHASVALLEWERPNRYTFCN